MAILPGCGDGRPRAIGGPGGGGPRGRRPPRARGRAGGGGALGGAAAPTPPDAPIGITRCARWLRAGGGRRSRLVRLLHEDAEAARPHVELLPRLGPDLLVELAGDLDLEQPP